MTYSNVTISPKLQAQLKEYSQTLVASMGNYTDHTPTAGNLYLIAQGIDFHETKHIIYTPYGVNNAEYKEAILADIRLIMKETGLLYFHHKLAQSLVATQDEVIGSIQCSMSSTSIVYRCWGHPDMCRDFVERLAKLYPSTIRPSIRRIEVAGKGLRHHNEVIPAYESLGHFRALYPYLDQTPEELWASFAASKSNVLLLIGPPGTGKSTFLMELLNARGWDNPTYLADSDEVLKSPDLIDFVRDVPSKSLFIAEDADTLVARREDGNALMSALLNATNGLISTDTKYVISTNLSNLGKVDPALIRPGRTFRVLPFSPLNFAQANAANVALGRPALKQTDWGSQITLSELLNAEENTSDSGRHVRRVGFSAV